MNFPTKKAAAAKTILAAAGILSLAAFSLLASAEASLAAAKAKFRSAHFIATALEAKGLTVEDIRRKGQLYMVKVSDDGTTAILAIDGYSAELVGLHVLTLAPGATAKPKGSGGNHFVDITYEYGYIVEESVYSSYTEVTTEELSMTEEYSETSIETSEEVSYEEIDDGATGDLDEGQPGDDEGDAMADDNDGSDETADDGADDGGADESADDGGADDGGDDTAEE